MNNLYRFGEFVLDPAKRTLSRADSSVFLTPKAFDVLFVLVQNPNRLITKEELLEAVWGGTLVEEGNLTQYISHIRKALNDSSEDARLIVTIPRKGYQFAGDVAVSEPAELAQPAAVQIPIAGGPQADTPPQNRRPNTRAGNKNIKTLAKSGRDGCVRGHSSLPRLHVLAALSGRDTTANEKDHARRTAV